MQFKQLIAATLVSVAAAQDPASVAAFGSAVASYIQSLVGDQSFIQQVAGLATADPAILSSLQALATASVNPADLTAPPSFIQALPTPYNSIFESVYSRELALASQYGLVSGTSVASLDSSAVASITSQAGGASVTSAISSAVESAGSSISNAGTSATGAAGSQTSSVSKAGAAPTGVAMMGLAAGAIGAIAALL